MRRGDRRTDRVVVAAAVLGCGALLGVPLEGAERTLRSKAHNYSNSPLTLSNSKVELVETFSSPTQAGIPGTGRSRVRYANRAGQVPPTYVLNGEVFCSNTASQGVEALKLGIVILDAFHEPVFAAPGQRRAYVVQQVLESIPRKSVKRITWEQRVDSVEIFEVAVVVTGVRFVDGSVWLAPQEELIEVF